MRARESCTLACTRLRTPLAAACTITACLLVPAAASADLTFINQFGSQGTGNSQFNLPQGVAVDGGGNVYVADSNNGRIQKFTSRGSFLLAFGAAERLNSPGSLALDPQGNLLVDDVGNYRVLKYSPAGALLGPQYGSLGQAPGQYNGNPKGVAADAAGNVYVLDTGAGGRIDKFSAAGAFLTSFGSAGTARGQWQTPHGLAADAAGNVYVGDSGNHRIDVFASIGTPLREIGSGGSGPSLLGQPNEVAIDSRGNVFVADGAPGGIVEFAPNGTFVSRTADTGTAADPIRPSGVAVGPGDEVFASDFNVYRVLHFRQAASAPPAPQTPPPPQLGRTATVAAVTGTVTIRVPGSSQFANLATNASLPLGSTLDTTRGSVSLLLSKNGTSATQPGTFNGGQFKITQAASGRDRGLTQLALAGGGLAGCSAKGSSAARARSRRLFSSVRGRFRTRGRYSAATVRGTKWLEQDSCSGTLTRVFSGTVVVRDFAKRRNVRVKQGKSYLAKKPARRKSHR